MFREAGFTLKRVQVVTFVVAHRGRNEAATAAIVIFILVLVAASIAALAYVIPMM